MRTRVSPPSSQRPALKPSAPAAPLRRCHGPGSSHALGRPCPIVRRCKVGLRGCSRCVDQLVDEARRRRPAWRAPPQARRHAPTAPRGTPQRTDVVRVDTRHEALGPPGDEWDDGPGGWRDGLGRRDRGSGTPPNTSPRRSVLLRASPPASASRLASRVLAPRAAACAHRLASRSEEEGRVGETARRTSPSSSVIAPIAHRPSPRDHLASVRSRAHRHRPRASPRRARVLDPLARVDVPWTRPVATRSPSHRPSSGRGGIP